MLNIFNEKPLCFGTWGLGGNNNISGTPLGWPEIGEKEAVSLIRYAREKDIKFFDTSDFYGQGKSEYLLNKALGKDINNVFITTKGGIKPDTINKKKALSKDFSIENLRNSITKSLKNLNRDFIDLYLLHGASLNDVDEEMLNFFSEIKQAGLVKYFGVSLKRSNVESEYTKGINLDAIDALQFQYNVMNTKEIEFIKQYDKKNKITMARSIFYHGLLLKRKGQFIFTNNDHRISKTTNALENLVLKYEKELNHQLGISTLEASLFLAIHNENIDLPIVGLTNKYQLDELIIAKEKVASIKSKENFNEILKIANNVFHSECHEST